MDRSASYDLVRDLPAVRARHRCFRDRAPQLPVIDGTGRRRSLRLGHDVDTPARARDRGGAPESRGRSPLGSCRVCLCCCRLLRRVEAARDVADPTGKPRYRVGDHSGLGSPVRRADDLRVREPSSRHPRNEGGAGGGVRTPQGPPRCGLGRAADWKRSAAPGADGPSASARRRSSRLSERP
jgi:hypothetical protein